MFSVLLSTRDHSLLGFTWLMVLTIGGFALSALLSWTTHYPRASRMAVMLGIALVLGGGLAYADLVCCQQCDPWWLEYFWVCVPAA